MSLCDTDHSFVDCHFASVRFRLKFPCVLHYDFLRNMPMIDVTRKYRRYMDTSSDVLHFRSVVYTLRRLPIRTLERGSSSARILSSLLVTGRLLILKRTPS